MACLRQHLVCVCVCVCVCGAARRVVVMYRLSCSINCRSGKLMMHHRLRNFGQPRKGSLWDVILSGIAMGGSGVADGVSLFPLSAILPIPLQVAPAHRVTTSNAHISRADDFSRTDAKFVRIVFSSSCLWNVCTLQFACLTLNAVVEIYNGHVGFKKHSHMKTCRLQTFLHGL
jgi:hypothetical protein